MGGDQSGGGQPYLQLPAASGMMWNGTKLGLPLWELSFVRSCGEEFVEAYNRNTMPPHLLWIMLNQPLCRDYLWTVMRNQLPVVQREWKSLSAFPEWPGSRGWLPVLIIPFNQELILRHGRQQPVSLGSRPYLCVVVQGVALLGEYTRRGQHGTNKRYGIFSTVNWTLMYDVENHRYANEFPSTIQVFHFKPKSRPLTTKRTSHLPSVSLPLSRHPSLWPSGEHAYAGWSKI